MTTHLVKRKPHIRLYTKRPNGGAWFAVVTWKGWSQISCTVSFYSTLPELFEAIRNVP